jgi:hypothetical protein
MRTFLSSALLGVFAFAAFAADITGKWIAKVPGRGGNMQTYTFVFKADGAKLTGTLRAGAGGNVALTDGKIDGDNISFVVVRTLGKSNEIKDTYKGTVSGSEIKFTTGSHGFNQSSDPPPVEFTAKKAN